MLGDHTACAEDDSELTPPGGRMWTAMGRIARAGLQCLHAKELCKSHPGRWLGRIQMAFSLAFRCLKLFKDQLVTPSWNMCGL